MIQPPKMVTYNMLNLLIDFQNVYEEEHEMNGMRADDSDSDDGLSDVGTHDDIESSEEEAEKVKDRDLEWDDSTLSF